MPTNIPKTNVELGTPEPPQFSVVGLAVAVVTLAGAVGLGATAGPSAIHCSLSTEPHVGAVETALAILFGLLLVLRYRQARQNAARDQRDSELPHANGRIPYRDLGMRESVASINDER